jgi:hypothetical protein
MALNIIPHAIQACFAFARKILNGLTAIGAAIYVKQNTPAVVGDALDVARAAQTTFEEAGKAKSIRVAECLAADDAARAFLTAAVTVLKLKLGNSWGPAWEGTGLPHGSLALPKTTAGRLETLHGIAAFLTAHADMENAAYGVTAVKATEHYTALDTAVTRVGAAETEVERTRAERDTSFEALRHTLRGTLDELTELLAPDDPRWATFGLDQPAAPNRPEVPHDLVAEPGPAGSHKMSLTWTAAARAERYRVYKEVVGLDPEFVAAVTVTDPDATLDDLPTGTPIKVCVTAANETGETKPSEEVTVTLA